MRAVKVAAVAAAAAGIVALARPHHRPAAAPTSPAPAAAPAAPATPPAAGGSPAAASPPAAAPTAAAPIRSRPAASRGDQVQTAALAWGQARLIDNALIDRTATSWLHRVARQQTAQLNAADQRRYGHPQTPGGWPLFAAGRCATTIPDLTAYPPDDYTQPNSSYRPSPTSQWRYLTATINTSCQHPSHGYLPAPYRVSYFLHLIRQNNSWLVDSAQLISG